MAKWEGDGKKSQIWIGSGTTTRNDGTEPGSVLVRYCHRRLSMREVDRLLHGRPDSIFISKARSGQNYSARPAAWPKRTGIESTLEDRLHGPISMAIGTVWRRKSVRHSSFPGYAIKSSLGVRSVLQAAAGPRLSASGGIGRETVISSMQAKAALLYAARSRTGVASSSVAQR